MFQEVHIHLTFFMRYRLRNQPSPSTIIQPATPELKPLPSNLKYAYLHDSKSFPVIISASLVDEQEEKLLFVLKKHKKAIGWTLADIPGISPSTCMHRINLEDGACHTLISSGDCCLMACNLWLTASRYLAPFVAQ